MNENLSLSILRTVFVITDQVQRLRSVVVPLCCLLFVLVLAIVALVRLRGKGLRILIAVILPVGFYVCLFWSLHSVLRFFLYLSDPEYAHAIQQYQGGDYKVAEGAVSDIQYTRESGFCFFSGTTQICSGPHPSPVGYHRNGRSRFILQNGMKVKVYFHGGTILRIDQLN